MNVMDSWLLYAQHSGPFALLEPLSWAKWLAYGENGKALQTQGDVECGSGEWTVTIINT